MAPWPLLSLFAPSGLWDRSWSIWKTPCIPERQRKGSLQWVFARLHWADWHVAGPSHCRTLRGSQEWGCGSFSTGRACVYCWAQGGLVWGNSNRCSPSCPDLLPSRILAHPAWTGPLNRGRGTLPGLYATLLDWHCCALLYSFLLFCSVFVFFCFRSVSLRASVSKQS